ncbi:winged helix-turn-helix transcriptional regulator [Nocardia jejuensis]|uniref:winged helix-turn-helix transcriptional regulator n=1 Tax=Nocardia jejuensis TaxID=328049 RepID=UPI0008373AAA|nr:helix-turn-helix domain-containing protein [Nocardia jejuensis]
MDTVSELEESGNLVDSYLTRCPARDVLAVLADKWVLLVLGVLRSGEGPIRFNELRRRMDGITQKMLTRTLRDLEREGLVRRSVYPTVPPRVEYSLTPLGQDLGRITHAMGQWAVRNADEITTARAEFDERMAREPEPISS